MYGCHFEMAKSVAEGRRKQMRESAVANRIAKLIKQEKRPGPLAFLKRI